MNQNDRIDLAALLLRAGLGTMFIAHALLKVLVFTMPGTVGFFESLGLPGALAYATVGAELAGGALLLAGVYTRLVALALVPVLAGATWVHLANGWVFSAEGGGWEYPAFLILTSLVLALIGGGRYVLASSLATLPSRLDTGHGRA